ncbi:MAG: asparagine synthase (glutamine-hydrolyzing) [Magnetococcus sp. DMHC-6]
MCGIAGRLDPHKVPNKEILEAMAARLIHRGPDAGGIHIVGHVGLAHRRLAILDLSTAGTQPMSDCSGHYWIVFNGEIYNFKALRQELTSNGAVFRSQTDTEVILEAYKQWGVSCLKRFNGMFALALWDGIQNTLLLARDRLGKKPLFYYPLPDGGIIFASELKALLADPDLPRQLDPTALGHYLSLNYTLTDNTMIAGVKKLPAAHHLSVRKDGHLGQIQEYWDLRAYFHAKRIFSNEQEVVEEFRELLLDAIRLRLIADVPVGVFLSGGLDSSTVVALMSKVLPAEQIKTFTIGFKEQTYSEVNAARQVTAHFGIQPQIKVIGDEMIERLEQIAWYCDEPFSDSSIFPMVELAKFARNEITVALSGDGADELLVGYTTYTADQIQQWTRWMPNWMNQSMRYAVEKLVPVTFNKIGMDYKLRQFLAGNTLSPERAHYSWRTIFSDAEKIALVHPKWRDSVAAADPFIHFQRHFDTIGDAHYLDRAMYVDIKTWLVDDILVKVDRATMASSLELRAPFMDYRLVELAATLPMKYKIKGMQRKRILKQSSFAGLPSQVLNRPKEGFNAPISHWLGNMGQTLFGNLEANPLAGEYLDQKAVARLWREHQEGRRDNGLRLLGLVMLHYWLKIVLKSNGL